MEKRRALLPSLLTTGILALSALAGTQGLELTSSVLVPPIDQDPVIATSTNFPTRYNIITGAVFTISCTFTHTDNDFTVSFYKDGVVITVEGLADVTLTETQDNVDPNIEKMLELKFSDFQQAHDGVYHCSASVEGVDPVSSEMYFYGSSPPTVGVTPSEPLLSVAGSLTLTCTGSDTAGTTTFTFSWLLNDSPVHESLVNSVDVTSQLSVTSVTSTDFGIYTCNVRSDHGTGAAVAYVRETGSLVFTTDLTAPPMDSFHSLDVLDGETNRYNIEPDAVFSLDCTAESPEDFTLSVMSPSVTPAFTHSLTESTTTMPTTFVKTQTLTYSPFTADLNGIYWCRAESSTTPNELESRRILLGTGPAAVTRVSDQYIELIPPNPLELQVMVAGAYESLTWSRGGVELAVGDSVSFSDFRQTLTISTTSSGDAGEYIAEVSGSESVTFQVQEFSAPQITVSAPSYVIQGDTLTVNCSVTSFPQSSVSLSLGDTPLVTTVSEVYDPTAGSFSYFTTHSTTVMHPSDEGSYTCSATITHGQPAVTEMLSNASFVAVYVPLEVDIPEETYVVNETNPAILTCVATSIPAPSISWFVAPSFRLNGGGDMMVPIDSGIDYNITSTTRVLSSQNIEVTSTLTVHNTAMTDSGVYTCEAMNSLGRVNDTAELIVQSAPIMLNITANPSTGVPQGLTLNLICEAVGEPTLNVTWITPTGKRVGPVISVDSVTAGDAGDYTCEVTADDRSASSSITIRVGVRVTPPMDQFVSVNGTLRLTCDVSGSEPISYQWSKDGQQLQDSVRVSGSSTSVLVVEPVEGDDFGGYRCNASNDVDQVQSEVAMVAVAPEIVTISATPSTGVAQGTTITLTCEAVGGPTLNVTWTTPTGPRVGSVISVDSVTVGDAGDYTCEVTSEAGTDSDVITIRVQPFIRDPPVDLTVNQSSPATFSCTAQGNPVPTISWTGPSASFTTEDTLGTNFTVLSVLTIDSAVKPLHEGAYTCSASNGVESSPNSSAALTVQVPPTVQADQGRMVGIQEMSVTLSFTISGAAPEVQTRNIQWTFTDGNNFSIPTNSYTTTFSNLMGVFSDDRLSLTLSGLSNDFEGMYTLTATNEAGSDSAVVQLAIEGPPRITTPPMSQQVVNGVNVTFDCYALAEPVHSLTEPVHSLTWYFISANGSNTTIGSVNGTEGMTTDSGKYQITNYTRRSDYGRLVVRGVQFEDRGTYMCLAENRHGTDTASATLSVQVPPVFLSTSPRVDIVMNSSDAVILNCSLQGYPLSLLRWRKDGNPLVPDGSHITITTFRRQDPTETYPFSSSVNSNFNPIPQEDLEYFEAVSELTLIPPLLLTDTANYTCEVEADFVENFTETSDNIPVVIIELPREFTANIELIFGPVSDCPTWVDINTEAKLSDISAALSVSLQRECSCPLSVQQSIFSCLGTDDSRAAVFLAELSYTALPGAVNVPSLLDTWVASTPRITVASTQLQVDMACSVQVNSSDGQSCVPTTTTAPTVPSTLAANIGLYVLVATDLVFVITLALVVSILAVICHRLRKTKHHHNGRRYSRSPLEEEQDYDGPGYVVMENLTKSSEVPDLVETENPLGTDY